MSTFKRAGDQKSKFQRGGYDKQLVGEWERANKESVNTLNTITAKSQKNEYLSSDDLATYRTALDSYIETSNNLRGITKSLGGTLEEDDATWESKIASMNSAYEETQKHYGKWKNEKAYKKNLERQKEQWEAAKAAQKEREGMLAYDSVAGEATIKDLESTYNEAMKIVNAINERTRLLQYGNSRAGNLTSLTDEAIAKDSVIAQLREQLAPYGDVDALEKELGEKKRYHTLAGRLQNAEKLASVVGNEDFGENSQYISTEFTPETFWDKFHSTEYDLGYDDLTHQYINGDDDFRAEVNRKHEIYGRDSSWQDTESEYEEANYAQMNETEIAIYNYYYNTDGKEKAEEYLDSIQETLNYREAEKRFGGLEGNTLLEMVFAVEAGLDQFRTGVDNLFSNADYIPTSEAQMLSGMVREDLADNGATLPDWLGGASLGQVAYDSITTTSNMLPSIMISAIPGVGQVAGAVTLGASAAGHAKAEMLNLGYTKAQANTYGLMVGASEAGLQYLIGGITKLGGKAPEGLTKLALSKVDNAFARVAISLGMNMASEGLEESLQTVIEPWLKSLATGVDFESPNIDEVLYSGLLGAISSLFLEGGTTIAGEVNVKKQGANLKQAGAEKVNALVGLGKEFAEGTTANRLANNANENSSAYTIGRLLTEVGGSLSERNIADIASDLQAKGMSPGAATDTAKWLYKAVEGGHFNRRQQREYLEDDRISDVHRELFTNDEHSVHKRNAEYDALYKLANEMNGVEETAKTTSEDAKPTTEASVTTEASIQQAEAVPVTENAPVKEIATEGKSEASETGKTTYNGAEVKVQRIESINGKDVMVRIDNGETVNARDIDFSSEEEGLLYEVAIDMDVDTANAFILGYYGAKNAPLAKPMTLDQYVPGFKEARLYGELGIPYEAIARDGKYANGLFESQKKVAYQSGYDYGVKKANDAQAAVSRGATKAKTPRTYKGETHISEIKKSKAYKSLSDTQKAGIDGMLFLYKALGIDVYFFESPTDKNGKRKGENGYFNPKDGSVHIDLYAGKDGRGLILFTGAHELTHYIRAKLPAKFKVFADALLKQYEANGNSIATRIAVKKANLAMKGRTKGMTPEQVYDLAYEEVVADACEAMLANGEAFVQISEEIKAKDKGLWEAIKSFFANLVARIKGEYANLEPDSIAGKKVAEMLETATELQRMWVDMLIEASTQEQFSTDSIRGNADGAVAKSEVTEALVDSTANDGILLSTRTEFEALPKQSMSLSTGAGTILHSIEGLKPTLVKGITEKSINGFTGRAVREYAMGISGFTKKQIGEVNKFMDAMADFMKEAGVTYRFIGLQDVENAKLHYTYNPDGSIKSVVLSAMVKNGDYPVNFDLSSICKKREAMSALIRKLAQRGSIDNGTVKLTPSNIFKINTALKDAGYETACLGCFVESKRYNSMEWAKKFCDKWNAAVKKVNPNATYFGYGDATFNEDSFTLEQAIKIDDAANKYIKTTKTERLANALAKYKAKEQAGQPLVAGKVMKVDGEELNTFSKAARDRLAKSDTISEELKTKYLTCDVSTLTLGDVEFLLENGVLPGASLSNKQAVTEMVKSGEAYQHLLRPSDLLTDRGISKLEALPNFHGVLYGHYGSGTPKLMQSYTPYNSEIALLPANKNNEQTLAEYLYTIAGVRMQSFSDFQIQNIYDYLQMVADLAARKVPAHAYTKEISFAKLLGMTGIKVNLSVMFDIDPTVDEAHAGLTKLNQLVHKGEYAKVVLEDAQGKWVYNIGDYQTQKMFEAAYPDEAKRFLQSIGFADAVKLQSSTGYSANCGIIGVGYSDLGIFAMLDDNRIRYIIPYHASSLPADIKVATRIELGTDYTPYQNNMKIVGIEDRNGNKVKWTIKEAYKRLGSGQAVINELNDKVKNEGWVVTTKKAQTGHGTYGLYENLQETNDPRQTASNFMDWCIGNSTLPLFYQFASHENYYKMLYDYNVYDCVTEEYAPQQAVTNTYPTIVDGEVKAGTVTDGGFNAEYLQGTIDKQMAFMNQYGENLDSDLEKLADNMEEGNYSLHNGFMFSDRTSNNDEEGSLDNNWDNRYNLYTTTDDFIRQVPHRLRSGFARSLANKTSGMTKGEIRTIYVCGYIFEADGYMHGHILAPYNEKTKKLLEVARSEYNRINEDTESASLWTKAVRNAERGSGGDSGAPRRGRSSSDDRLLGTSSERYSSGDNERIWETPETKKKNDEIIKRLRKMYGLDAENDLDAASSALERTSNDGDATSDSDILYSDRESYAPTFYSHMGKVIDDIKLEKMGSASILNHLKNRGVKAEEIKWSGIEAFLEGKKSVTKAELQEFVAGSQLVIEEEMSGAEAFDIVKDGDNYIVKDRDGNILETWEPTQDPEDPNLKGWISLDGGDIASTVEEIREYSSDWYGEEGTRWSQYRLDGGTNYRELVFKMPNSSYSNRAMRVHWGNEAEGIVVHARIQDFDVNGKKMLFIEELQSDWHNEGREKGYTTEEYEDAVATANKLDFEYSEIGRTWSKYIASSEFGTDSVEVRKQKYEKHRIEEDAAMRRKIDAKKKVDDLKKKGMGDVDDAPFRDTYHEYVLKRLLRMAAEEGYDAIGWTPADIQSKRWSYDYEKAYKIEYDQEMPKFLRKYGKQWGATVGTSIVSDTEVWSMDIPDSMTESVLHEGQVMYSDRVTDKKTLDFLENQEHITTYKSFVEIDGKLYSPMATKVKGDDGKYRLTNPSELGAWQQAEEKPDSIPKFHKSGYGYYVLKKDDGGTVTAAYNPYEHSSNLVLNDQFESAYQRPNLVTVECVIPKSEMTSGYKAKFAKDSVGYLDWKSGTVAGKLKGNKRKVYLSRWLKPVRILSDAEVASMYKDILGSDISVPFNVVTPQLLTELEKVGVKIDYEGSPGYQYRQSKKATDDGTKFSDRDPDSVSNRSLLANALESVAQNDVERNKLAEYKSKIALIESEQAKWAETKAKIKELSFAKGKRDTEAINKLQFEANQSANRINTYDRQLLSLESTKALKGVLEREKQMAYKRAEKKGKEALARQREKDAKTQRELLKRSKDKLKAQRERSAERRDKTTLRRKIRKVVKDLNSLLKNGNKKRNIKEEMQDTVASSLALADILFSDDIKNEDIVMLGVDSVTEKESVALNKYRDLLEERDALQAKIETIYGSGIARETLLAEVGKVTEELDKVNGRIAYLNNKLSDLFERERARLNRSTVDAILDDLITEYSKLESSENGYIKNAYSDAMKKRLETLKETFQGKIARDMDVYQLSELYDTFKMIEHMVRHSNNLFREGRLEDLMTYVSNAQGELYEASTEQKDGGVIANALESAWNEFTWNNLRPVDAFERLGSPTLEKLFWDFVHAMGVAARDITEAGEVIAEAREKYGYSKWDMSVADTPFTTRDGMTFKPSLADKLSIYAYSKRDQAEKHMVDGGFTFDTGRTYKDTENGKTYVRRKLSNTYRLTKETIDSIIASLEQEQRDYVDAILPYLTDMGKKGNEVSMTLYGIELFGEKVYFPLQSSKDYLSSTTQTLGATPTMASLANSGFTKQTTPNADNPIVLRGFDDVVLEHIEKMSNYHALVLPIENLRRVFDNVSRDADRNSIATKALIGSRFGVEAQKYFEQWLTDINGGIMPSGVKHPFVKWFSRAKGMSVAANLSVVAQQYFSIVRAMELVDPKYFAPFLNGEAKKTDMKQYEELLKYAPIAIIKEMGGFDVGSSGRVKDYIGYEGARKDAKYINKKIDDLSMWGAGQMDKLGWVTIWKAVKAEVASEQKLTPGTDEFYEACKKRFTEVVTKTQVYDSVASRSGYMRSQHDLVKQATSFMGEPTAIVGRLFVASHNLVRAYKSGNKARIKSARGRCLRTATVIAVANVLGNLAKSLVYAGRDDEEDEALLEKWMRNFGEALLNDLNILNSLPFGRDIVSAWEGWDVERLEMTLITDMITSAKKMLDGDITLDDSLNLVGSAGNFLGKPLKNVIREIKAAINVIGDITDDVRPTNMGGAFVDGFNGTERTKTDKLYSAILRGDDDRVKVMKESYDSDSEYNSAVRKALRENDPRIKEAAMAFFEQNHSKRQSLTLEIEKEGKFAPTFVRGAINNEIQYLKNKINDAKVAKKKGDTKEYNKIVKTLREKYPKDFVEKVLG